MPTEILFVSPKVIDDPGYACVPGRWFASGIPHGLPNRFRGEPPNVRRMRNRLASQLFVIAMIGPVAANWEAIKQAILSGPFVIMVSLGLVIRLALWCQGR